MFQSGNQFTLTYFLVSIALYSISTYGQVTNNATIQNNQSEKSCYGQDGAAIGCYPPFQNVALNKIMFASDTCGQPPRSYCVRDSENSNRQCFICNASNSATSHPAQYLTDSARTSTWWQSNTYAIIGNPNSVVLQLLLNKTFDITYIIIYFRSMRPESLQIDKKTTLSSPWQTYQYFSQSCTKTYNLPVSEIRKSTFATNKTKVICVQGSTEITPFTGGTITFDATAGRAETRADFLQNPELSDWVTVSALKIELRRLNTFGDDNFGDENSYFYAISDIVVGGRCKCNGHGASCYYDNSNTLTCRCQHNTQGRDCQSCQSKFNDRPWAAATDSEANECIECKCYGLAESCNFNRTLYEATGSGGICVGCRNGATGINCQKCLSAYYPIDRNDPSKGCQNCSCNAVGSLNSVCDSMGRCRCKPGVAGDKCDRCQAFYYNFTSAGCSSCDCSEAGTRADSSDCDKITGQCQCKVNVIGKQCDRCITSHFALSVDNPEGCQRCFCFQHGTECLSASNYKQSMIKSDFQQGFDGWRITDDTGRIIVGDFLAFNWTIGSVSATVVRADSPLAYFYAPLKFRGDQRYSYGKSLRISISATAPNTTSFILTSLDVQILGGIGNSKRLVTSSLSRVNQSQILPSNQIRWYDLRLHEGPTYGWSPSLSSIEFQSILYNIEQVIIIAKFSGLLNSVVRLHNVTLQSAELINNQELSSSYILANYVEECTCAKPYGGLSCQLCADGYRRDQFGGTVYTECVPCQCNNQAATCNTTMCHCLNHTAGTFCENCQSGYYGEATDGGFCSRCPSVCNLSKVGAGGECLKDDQNKIICTNCRRGYAYPQCIHCSDGYYGDPAGIRGVVTPCQQCQCNGNIDPNAVGNCNRTTGECYKCIYNTEGFYCQQCLINYYGNALSPLKGKQCKACNCHPFGTNSFRNATSPCNRITGQCSCRKNVINRDCSQCKANFWGINSGEGCISCKNCSKTGSVGCDQITGDCLCKPNVGGELCDRCLHGFYNFSIEGCTACRCDPFGIYNTSNGRQCFENGTCTCRSTTIIGEKCDQCVINHHSLRVYSPQQPCQECDQCYGQFVKTYVNQRRTELLNLQEIIAVLLYNPTSLINVTQFEIRVEAANGSIQQLLNAMQVVVQQDIQMYTTLSKIQNTTNIVKDRTAKTLEDVAVTENKIKVIHDDRNMVLTRFSTISQMIDNNSALLLSNTSYLMDTMRQLSTSSANLTEITNLAKKAKEILYTNEKTVNRIEQQTRTIEANINTGETRINETNKLQSNIIAEVDTRNNSMISLASKTNDDRNKAEIAYNTSSAALNIARNHQVTLASIKILANVSTIEEQLRIDNILLSDLRRNRSTIFSTAYDSNITEEVHRKTDRINFKLDESTMMLSRLAYILALSDKTYYDILKTAKDSNVTVDKVRGVIALLESAATGLQVNISLALENIPELATTVGIAEKEISSIQNGLVQAYDYLDQSMRRIQATVEIIARENQTTVSYEPGASSVLSNTSELRTKLDKLTGEIRKLADQISQLRTSQASKQEEVEEIIRGCNADSRQKRELDNRLISGNHELDDIEKNLAIADNWNSSNLKDYLQRINTLSQQLTRADARIQTLSQEKDRLDAITERAFVSLAELRIHYQAINQAQASLSPICINFPIIAEDRQVQGQ